MHIIKMAVSGLRRRCFGGVRVAHLVSFLCCVFCFVCLCPVPMFLVSLDCPFVIAPSISLLFISIVFNYFFFQIITEKSEKAIAS